ncbi:class I adenylate-forming enzyme family protein [Brevibacterium zhoupengii]|uniref:class I adenylate-forming enzyme family protein n=1 Tax=Brevibacterium zhoupengii TaxID=2898795 RepID=UPI001F09D70D|nr:AMP-binding protein [Brevibacterium zhoupengii]
MAATQRTSLIDLLIPWAETIPDSVVVRTPPGPDRVELSELRFLGEVEAARDRYRGAGLAPGDRTVLIAPSCPEFLIEFLGAHAAGLAVVAVNPLSTARELVYILQDSEARRLVAHPAMAEAGKLAAGEAGIDFATLPLAGNEGPSLELSADGAAIVDRVDFEWNSLAALLYTSGTTGKPKGAMLSLGNFIATTDIVKEMTKTSPDDRSATGLPLFHVFGLADMALPALSAGAPLTLFPRWDPQAFADALAEDEVSIISGVPTMWMSVLTNASEVETPHLRLVSSGGASIAAEVIRKVESRLSAPLAEGYGLTETAGLGTFNPLLGTRKAGSVGPPTPRFEVKVIDTDGASLPASEVGEVVLRGPAVMLGYWKKPEATAEVLDDEGWFRTGDLGHLDEDGYLFIVDRIKDLIIHGGYNVYPREVEEVLYEIPGVAQASVVGIPDEKYGQQVTAVIALSPGAHLDAAEVEKFARENLAAYKIPRIIEFVEELPKGPSGKILKREIVKMYSKSS